MVIARWLSEFQKFTGSFESLGSTPTYGKTTFPYPLKKGGIGKRKEKRKKEEKKKKKKKIKKRKKKKKRKEKKEKKKIYCQPLVITRWLSEFQTFTGSFESMGSTPAYGKTKKRKYIVNLW